MCFSAGASIGAGVALGAIGAISLKKAKAPGLKALAMIPVLFSIQQFIEGITWLEFNMQGEPAARLFYPGSVFAFLFFAWIIWPVYVPYAMMRLERNARRRNTLLFFLMIGAMVAFTLLYTLLFQGVTASIEGHHIIYQARSPHWLSVLIGTVYMIPTLGSCLISSNRKVVILGIVNAFTLGLSFLVFQLYVTSVWCFFAAISSILILWIIATDDAGTDRPILQTNDESKIQR